MRFGENANLLCLAPTKYYVLLSEKNASPQFPKLEKKEGGLIRSKPLIRLTKIAKMRIPPRVMIK
jgi:hypothetical protein